MNQTPIPPDIAAMAAITDDDFKEFLNLKVKNHSCPSCASNSWAIIAMPGYILGAVMFTKDGGFNIPPPIIPFMAVACNSCGYIRQHALGTIAQWKASKSIAA